MKNVKLNPSNSKASSVALTLLALLLNACGGASSNPVENYQDLRVAGPDQGLKSRPYSTPTPPPTPVPVEPPKDPEIIFPMPTSVDDLAFNFHEGKASSYQIRTGCFKPGVTYDLVMTGQPEWLKIERSKDSKNREIYVLTGQPSKGTLSAAEHGHRHFPVRLSYKVIGAANSRDLDIIKKMNQKSYVYHVYLFNNEQDPEITKVKVESSVITEGDKVAITIEVADPSAYSGRMPSLKIEDATGGATDSGTIKGSSLFSLVGEPEGNDGAYVFKGILDSSGLVFPAGKDEVTVRFLVNARGVAGVMSAKQPVVVKVKRKAPETQPAPQPEVTPAPAAGVNAGTATDNPTQPAPEAAVGSQAKKQTNQKAAAKSAQSAQSAKVAKQTNQKPNKKAPAKNKKGGRK